MKITIPKEPNFRVPEGHYRAVLTNIIELVDRNQVRLVFTIIHPGGKKNYVAAKNYERSLARDSQLRQDLKNWRGRDITEEDLHEGVFDLDQRKGNEADLKLAHIKNDSHPFPYVLIAEISPPGSKVQLQAGVDLRPAMA